jgi:quercetin dioxygenase-like cupin family protein
VQITRNSLDTNPGPSDWFTGTVYIDTIRHCAPSRLGAGSVHFTPGARTAWQHPPCGQTIYSGPVTLGEHVTDEEYAAAPTAAP